MVEKWDKPCPRDYPYSQYNLPVVRSTALGDHQMQCLAVVDYG